MTLDTKALPAGPESAAQVRDLVGDGWRVTGRSHGTVRLARTAPDVATPQAGAAAGATEAEPDASPTVDPAVGPSSAHTEGEADRAEVVGALGVRVADALAASGFHSLSHARSAFAAAPEAFADLPGIGPATLKKLA